ncbi:MAG: hypothetical protein V3V67_16275 [Myxococcota bacterium]
MGRLFGILAIVLGVWIGLEVYTKGTDQAFGGIFAGLMDPVSDSEPSPDGRSPVQRIGDQVRDDINLGADRTLRHIDRDWD